MRLLCVSSPLGFNIPYQDKLSVIDKKAGSRKARGDELAIPKRCGPSAESCLSVQVGNGLLEVCKLLRLPLSLPKDRDRDRNIACRMNSL